MSAALMSDTQIKDFHRRHALTEADFQLIYTHCQIIDALATQLLNAKPINTINRQLVHVGCMLHDIGAYNVLEEGRFVQGVRHGVLGEAMLREAGLPEPICRFASHHTGVGLTRQDIIDQGLPMPAADYLAETDEERLIMYADNFHSKSSPPDEPPYFCTFGWFRASIQKFGPGKAAIFDGLAEQFGKPDLEPLSRHFGHAVKDL